MLKNLFAAFWDVLWTRWFGEPKDPQLTEAQHATEAQRREEAGMVRPAGTWHDSVHDL